MNELDTIKTRGWSYYVGWNQDHKLYLARAWRPLPKPRYNPIYRSRELVDVLTGVGKTMDEAAQRLLPKVLYREKNGRDWYNDKSD